MKPVNRRLLWALVLCMLLSIAPAVRADWRPGDPYKMHYPQLPDPQGWDICVVDQHVADDFMCTESGKITDIHIWFSVERGQMFDLASLMADVSIWSNAGGIPGARLWTWSGGGAVNFVAPYDTGLQGWDCPSDTLPPRPNDHNVYHQVNITQIPDPFEQKKGETYWLVVRVLTPPTPKVGWKTSKNSSAGLLWGSPAMWSKNPDAGELWQPVNTGDFAPRLHDMAFVITGEATKPPVIVVTEWLNPEPWHRWFGPEEMVPVKIIPQDPCDPITKVDFFWSLDGMEWTWFGTDEDGSEPSLTTLRDVPPSEGDGWAAYLDPHQIPMMPGMMVMPIHLKAHGYTVDSFFDIFYEIDLDPSPPDAVEVLTQVREDTLLVDVNPNPDYPMDIQFVVIEVEPKEEEFAKGIPPLDQLKAGREYGGGYHCAPTATAACLKYFEGQGDDEIAGGLSGDDLTDALAGYEGCNDGGKGTFFGEWVDGISDWIADHGDGYTVRSFDYFDWNTARDELERCQDVLLRLQWPGDGGHALTLNSIHNTPEADGTIRIDLMDPYGGTISYGNLNPGTGQLTDFEGASGNSGTFTHMIIICPKEGDPGGGGDPIPGPDPGPITFPLPGPGKYFVRVTVVDVSNHAATLISIVQKQASEFGDAPEAALAYPDTCKIGAFPTCMNVGPATWIRHFSSGQLFFGPKVDLEPEGNAGFCPMFNPNTYNQDECFQDGDAGLIRPPAYTIVGAIGSELVVPCSSAIGSLGTVCTHAVWGQKVDIQVTNMTSTVAYVNVLMDWNKSGEWSGASVCPPCLGGLVAPEHVLRDLPVPPGYSGPLSGVMPVAFMFPIGPNPGHIWTRFTITPNMVGDVVWTGAGEFSDGESEDYLLAVDAAPVTTECDWNPGDPYKMHHPQEPDLTETGIDVDMFWTPLADDFKCSETGYITDIHFWGSFADDCLPPGGPASLTFQVTIYSDIPATPNRHSMPGQPVWGPRIFEPCTYSVRRMQDGPEAWYDPTTGAYMANNHQQAYQYNICISEDEAFRQQEGIIYWLEIKDIPNTGIEAEYTFGWKTTKLDLGWNDDAVYRSMTGGWAELRYPQGHPYHPASLNLAFVITGEGEPEPPVDWGDAPDPTYPTLVASLGASHPIWLNPPIYMGATVDADPDGQPTAAADGDDTDADGDDEDGVSFDTPMIPGAIAQITVNASIAGAFISVWIDFDGDGGWAEAADYVVPSVMSVLGNNVFAFPVPAGAVPGTPAYVRVRFTTFPLIPYFGPAPNGEVEDYVVVIEPPYQPKPPVPHLKWSQPPIEINPIPGQTPTFCGWDELSCSGKDAAGIPAIWKMAADDFRCLGRMPITSIHWWGSHYGWVEPGAAPPVQPIAWDISFWRNVPAGGTSDFSQPGDRLWTIHVDDTARVSVETAGKDFFHNMHPADVCYQYTLYLEPTEYFWQDNYVKRNSDGTAADTVFWISIQAVYPPGEEIAYPWGWKSRPSSWMDDGVRRVPLSGNPTAIPVSHWPFEEGRGTTTADVGPGGNNGTLKGDTAWVVDPLRGNCLDFDGSGDYVVTANTTTGLNFAPGSFSVSAWVNARTLFDAYRAIVDYNRSGSNWFTIFLHPGGGFHFRVGLTYKNSDRVLSSDEWYLLTATYDSTNRLMKLYVNGQFDCSATQSQGFDAPASSKVTIGANGTETAEYFDGKIDDVRIYSFALSPGDIQTLIDGCVWQPIEDPLCGESFDLAFELDTDPEYIKWEQAFNGLRLWPHYEDEESMGWEREGTPTKWQQPPDVTLPGLHCNDSITLADDWYCQGGVVTDLHWYGNYESAGRGIATFHLSIHEPSMTAPCLPGNQLWAADVPFASVSETDTGLVNNEGCKIYLYRYDLPTPFPQILSRTYWLDISAKSAYTSSPAIWRWQEAGRSPTPILCGAASRSGVGPWQTIVWPAMPPETQDKYTDLAFAITSGPSEPIIEFQRLVADDWKCTTMQPVTAAVWWGSYIGYRYIACDCLTAPQPVRPTYFYLSIWTDVPAGIDATYSHPGEKVWEYKAYEFDEVLVGFDKHPEGVPGQPFGREPVFRYSVRLPSDAWFHQEQDDAIYWFSVVAVYQPGVDPTYMWGWTNHEHMFKDDAVAGYPQPTGAGGWLWEPLEDQTGNTEDMSFILFTEPGCFPSSFTTYLDWLAYGKPDCWCNSAIKPGATGDYQCDGDASGNPYLTTGWRVYTDDLSIVAANWKRKMAPAAPAADPCADLSHKGYLTTGWRVYTDDLSILAANWKKKAGTPPTGLAGDCGLITRPE